jgi:branched-chain amino acid transport system substrate-binding protein
MSKKTAIVLSILLLTVIFIGCSITQSGKITKSDEPIKIGVIGPFTGDGAAYGGPYRQTIQLAVDEINQNGGIDGRQVQVIYEDGACTPKAAATAAQKLVSVDNVKVILGGFCSGETLGAAPITEQNKVILFSAGSSSPDITNAGDYVFRDFASDANSGSKIAETALGKGHKRIAILSEQTQYAQALRKVFSAQYTELGGEIVADESFTSDSSDFRSQLTKIRYAQPDAVYIVPQTTATLTKVLRQVREAGITQQIYTTDQATAQDALSTNSKELEGAIFAEAAFNASSPEAQQLMEKLRSKYGEVPESLPPVYIATTYDAVYILKDVIGICGEDTDCIKGRLYAIKDRPGTAGLLSIDQNGDAERAYAVKVIHDGKISEVR